MSNVYLVRVNSDTTEGKGAQVPKYAFDNKDDAAAVAKTLEPYKNQSGFTDVIPIPFFTSIREYAKWDTDKNKAKIEKGGKEIVLTKDELTAMLWEIEQKGG